VAVATGLYSWRLRPAIYMADNTADATTGTPLVL